MGRIQRSSRSDQVKSQWQVRQKGNRAQIETKKRQIETKKRQTETKKRQTETKKRQIETKKWQAETKKGKEGTNEKAREARDGDKSDIHSGN